MASKQIESGRKTLAQCQAKRAKLEAERVAVEAEIAEFQEGAGADVVSNLSALGKLSDRLAKMRAKADLLEGAIAQAVIQEKAAQYALDEAIYREAVSLNAAKIAEGQEVLRELVALFEQIQARRDDLLLIYRDAQGALSGVSKPEGCEILATPKPERESLRVACAHIERMMFGVRKLDAFSHIESKIAQGGSAFRAG